MRRCMGCNELTQPVERGVCGIACRSLWKLVCVISLWFIISSKYQRMSWSCDVMMIKKEPTNYEWNYWHIRTSSYKKFFCIETVWAGKESFLKMTRYEKTEKYKKSLFKYLTNHKIQNFSVDSSSRLISWKILDLHN